MIDALLGFIIDFFFKTGITGTFTQVERDAPRIVIYLDHVGLLTKTFYGTINKADFERFPSFHYKPSPSVLQRIGTGEFTLILTVIGSDGEHKFTSRVPEHAKHTGRFIQKT